MRPPKYPPFIVSSTSPKRHEVLQAMLDGTVKPVYRPYAVTADLAKAEHLVQLLTNQPA